MQYHACKQEVDWHRRAHSCSALFNMQEKVQEYKPIKNLENELWDGIEAAQLNAELHFTFLLLFHYHSIIFYSSARLLYSNILLTLNVRRVDLLLSNKLYTASYIVNNSRVELRNKWDNQEMNVLWGLTDQSLARFV